MLPAIVAAGLLGAALAVAGCGESDEETAQAPATAEGEERASPTTAPGDDSEAGEKSASQANEEAAASVERIGPPPTTKGGDNSIQKFGKEATAADGNAVAAAVSSFLRAQATGSWGRACALASSRIDEILSQLQGEGDQPDCEEFLAASVAEVPKAERRKLTKVRIGSVRVEGESGFAIFKGAGNKWLVMPMVREGGQWKVGTLAPSPLL